jgi:hypothetical protein
LLDGKQKASMPLLPGDSAGARAGEPALATRVKTPVLELRDQSRHQNR